MGVVGVVAIVAADKYVAGGHALGEKLICGPFIEVRLDPRSPVDHQPPIVHLEAQTSPQNVIIFQP